MKKFKKFVAIASVIGLLGAGSAVYAANIMSPADIASGLTGKTIEQVQEERANGQTYGAIAKDSGKLEEFKQQMLEQKKAILDQRVEDGRLTQDQADQIFNSIKDNQVNCDGNSTGIGKNFRAGFGQSNGMNKGMGNRNGNGMGFGRNLQR